MQEEVVKTHTHTRTYYHTFPSHHAFTSAPDGLTHTPFGAFKGLCFFSADDIQKYWMFFGSNLFPCTPPPPQKEQRGSLKVWAYGVAHAGDVEGSPVSTSSSATRSPVFVTQTSFKEPGKEKMKANGRKASDDRDAQRQRFSESHETRFDHKQTQKQSSHSQ